MFFILTLPLKEDGSEKVLIVNITKSIRVDEEYTLSPGDHSFIKSKSYINYPQAKKKPVKELEQELRQEKIIIKETADMDIIKYICSGLRNSRHSAKRFKEFCKKACEKAKNNST